MSLKLILDERKRRAAIVAQAGAILTLAASESRSMRAEETEKWNKLHADAEEVRTNVERLEAQRAAEEQVRTLVEVTPGHGAGDRAAPTAEVAAQRARVLRAFVMGRRACEDLSSEDLAAARRFGVDLSSTELMVRGLRTRPPATVREAHRLARRAELGSLSQDELASYHQGLEKRATMTTATDPAAIPVGFVSEVEKALLTFGGMREVARIMRTATGNPLPMPTVNDTVNTGELVAETIAVGEQAIHIDKLTLGAYTFSSKMIPVSLELLQDQAINMESLIGELAGVRIARALNTYLTTGTGVGQPKGVVTAAFDSGVIAVSATALTWPELLRLKHTVDPAYRVNGSWMFKDGTLLALKSLLDSTGRPLWAAGIGEGAPDTLDGDPYTINQDMAGMVAGAKSVLYGDFSKYLIRDVLDVQLVVLRERYAEQRMVGFFAFSRHDGNLLDAGTHPIKYLKQL